MPAQRYDVIVVGAGPGGLSCAALLAKWGIRTLLVDKNETVGGKAVTVHRNGFRYELGPKLQVPMREPAFASLFRELGIASRLRQIMLEQATLSYRGRTGEYRTAVVPQTGSDPGPLFDLWGLDEQEREQAVVAMARMVGLTGDALDELDHVSMQEYLEKNPVPHGLYNYMGMHANASLAEPIDLVAASEQIRILQQIAVHGGGGYYVGGFGRVLDDLAECFRASGGQIETGARVEQIAVSGNRVTGIRTADREYDAALVVSTAGIQPTVLKLVGHEHFEPDYVARVRDLVPGWGWASVRYFLGAPVMETGMAMVWADDSWWDVARAERVKAGKEPDEVIMFITVPARFDPAMAPPGRQCLVTGTVCSPDPNADEADMLYRKLDQMLASRFPEAWAVVERRECEGPREVSRHTRDHVLPGQGGECVGIGQIVGQCGRAKPSPRTPLGGLFLAGTDAGSACMGTHQASSSGMVVAGLVREALRTGAVAPAS